MAFDESTEVSPVADLLLRSAARFPERKALVLPGRAVRYAELREEAVAVARGLVALGVAEGSHVGILANNSVELVAAIFGVALANCVAVPLHARHKSRELGYIIADADIAAILTTAADTSVVDFRASLAAALPSLAERAAPARLSEAPLLRHAVVLAGEAAPGFMARAAFDAAAHSVDPAEIDARRRRARLCDPAILIYTSGTTANPKGCLLSHEAMTRGPVERAGRRFRSHAHDVTWGGGPLFHIGSLSPFLGVIGTAGTYCTDVVFEPGRALELIERERASAAWPWFPAILQPMLDHPGFAPERLASLRKMLLIGPEALVHRVQTLLPDCEVMQACGMTETAGIFALSGAGDAPEQRATNQGKAVPGVETRIIALDGSGDAAPGEIGEILVRGYNVMTGYYRAPDKTAEALDADRWLHTGDLYAMAADGTLTFHGRAKDMLKVGGENVAAIEIESYLCSHPSVKLAEVVGRPDPRLDEVPVAFVELRPGHSVAAEELIAFCTGRIASYKVPRAVVFMTADDWPMSATKVDKRGLRARL
ncbi:MAG: acyl--CoA ligase [Sphingomonadales bacterium]|nr:acyl--CoA ligase [Sphingomonadales bacterium]